MDPYGQPSTVANPVDKEAERKLLIKQRISRPSSCRGNTMIPNLLLKANKAINGEDT